MDGKPRKIRRVVVIDDSRVAQAIMEAAFGRRPEFTVVGVAPDATTGIEMIKRLAPDLVTLDLCMPYIDGAALLGMMTTFTDLCKIVISDQATKSILISKQLEALGATLCLGKLDLNANENLFFKKINSACERSEVLVRKRVLSESVSSTEGQQHVVRGLRPAVHFGYPVPIDEDARLAVLGRKRLANSLPECQFDLITRFAAEATEFPVCLLTFIDQDTQWVKSAYGFNEECGPRAHAFCNYTIATRDLFVIHNAETDARFANNPFVTSGPQFRTYAGHPVISKDGICLGALCVLDTRVRPLNQSVTRRLGQISEIIASIIEVRSVDLALGMLNVELNKCQPEKIGGQTSLLRSV
jgi:GAF domain-containing protein